MEDVSLKEFVELDWGFVRAVFGDWANSPYEVKDAEDVQHVLHQAALYVPLNPQMSHFPQSPLDILRMYYKGGKWLVRSAAARLRRAVRLVKRMGKKVGACLNKVKKVVSKYVPHFKAAIKKLKLKRVMRAMHKLLASGPVKKAVEKAHVGFTASDILLVRRMLVKDWWR